MSAFLADECCPKAVADRLLADGHQVRYAAETDHRTADTDLLTIANREDRVIVTEDFDLGDLIVRDGLPAIGAIILFLPHLEPAARADRLAAVLADPHFVAQGNITIGEARRLRQRPLAMP